jgi:hypothetical protein
MVLCSHMGASHSILITASTCVVSVTVVRELAACDALPVLHGENFRT